MERLLGGAEPEAQRQALAEVVLGGLGGARGGAAVPEARPGPPPAADAGSSSDAVGQHGMLAGVMADLAGKLPAVIDWVVAAPGGGYIAGDEVPNGKVQQGKEKGIVILESGVEVFICTRACLVGSGQMVAVSILLMLLQTFKAST